MLNITFRKYHMKKKNPVVRVALLKNPTLASPEESLLSAGEEAAAEEQGLIDSLFGETSRSIAGRNCLPQIKLGPAIRGPTGFAVAAAGKASLLLLPVAAVVNFPTAAGFLRSGRPPRIAVMPPVNTRDSIGSERENSDL